MESVNIRRGSVRLDLGLVRAIRPVWVALLLLLPAAAQAQFKFTTNNGAITITGYTGPGGNVTIPSTTNGYPVTAIGAQAFSAKPSLTDVIIPNSVTSIGDYAFFGCSGLMSVTIPNSVTSIGRLAFANCSGLTNIAVNVGNPNYASAGGVLFNNTMTTLIQYPGGTSGSYTIPNSVTNIGSLAFSKCLGLISVTIPNSVTGIGSNAFYYCDGLTTITVNAGNPNFASAGGVLFNNTMTTLIQYPGSLVGSYAIPNSVTNIGSYAFYDCFGLISVTIPNGVISIGVYAFWDCYGLRSLMIPNSATSIGQYAFEGCTNLHQAYFQGNAPPVNGMAGSSDNTVFYGESGKAYYLPGTTGWGATFGGWPTALWNPQAQASDSNFGVRSNRFGFTITGTTNIPIVVEAGTNLTSGVWTPLLTCILTNGSVYFSDLQWTNYTSRYYRLRSP